MNFIKRYKDLSLPIKAVIWFSICNFLLKGINFITVPLFTRMMSEAEYGVLSLYISYEQVLLILCTWEIQMGAYQKGIFKYQKDINFFTSATLFLTNILTFLSFLFLFLFQKWVYKFTGYTCELLILLFFYMLVQPSYNCWLVRKRTLYKYKITFFVTLLYSVLGVSASFLALYFFQRTAIIKYKAYLLSLCIICLFFYVPYANYFRLLKRPFELLSEWKFLLQFEGPLVLHSLSYFILSQADRIMIGEMVGKAETAYYSIAYSIANVAGILQTSINQVLLPWRYQMLEQKNYKKIREVTNFLLIGIGVVILLFILIAPEIIRLLFEKSYSEAIWSIPPISMSVYFMFLYTIFVNIETYFEKTKYVMYVSVVCGIINLILNYFGIIIFGYLACGYTTLISYILFSIGHYFFMTKVVKKELQGASVVSPKYVLIISIILVFLSVVFTSLYKIWYIRYFIVVFILFCLLLRREKIALILKVMHK